MRNTTGSNNLVLFASACGAVWRRHQQHTTTETIIQYLRTSSQSFCCKQQLNSIFRMTIKLGFRWRHSGMDVLLCVRRSRKDIVVGRNQIGSWHLAFVHHKQLSIAVRNCQTTQTNAHFESQHMMWWTQITISHTTQLTIDIKSTTYKIKARRRSSLIEIVIIELRQ